MMLPAGKYWVGDPEKVLIRQNDLNWYDFVRKCNLFIDPKVHNYRGRYCSVLSSVTGPGVFWDVQDNMYECDSGYLACIEMGLFKNRMFDNKSLGYEVTFDEPFECRMLGNDICFGDIQIDTFAYTLSMKEVFDDMSTDL